jgi:hypothetical protein
MTKIRRHDFINKDAKLTLRIDDLGRRTIEALCKSFLDKIKRPWCGYLHAPNGRIYVLSVAPGAIPVCVMVQNAHGPLFEKRTPRPRRSQAQMKADGLPRTILDDVREALPMVGQIFYPKSLAQRLSEKTGSKLHVNAVLPELNILRDHRKVRPVAPKMRYGQREPALQDLAWLRVG